MRQGELEEHEKMLSAMREVDVVISALPFPLVPAQLKIIQAIRAAGNIKVMTLSSSLTIHSFILTKIKVNYKIFIP